MTIIGVGIGGSGDGSKGERWMGASGPDPVTAIDAISLYQY